MGFSSKKCGTGEREVIGILQPWWRQLEPSALFSRSPGSGGWAKQREVPPGFTGHGDLMTDRDTVRLWRWTVEVKFRKTATPASVRNFVSGRPSPVWEWWDQVWEDAVLNRQAPMLWFRGNRQEWRVVVEGRGAGRPVPHLRIFTAAQWVRNHPRLLT